MTDKTPLTDEEGTPLRDKAIDEQAVTEAYARYLLSRKRPVANSNGITVFEACNLYLDYSKDSDGKTTYAMRAGTPFDFCTGLPAGFRDKKPSQTEREKIRIHDG